MTINNEIKNLAQFILIKAVDASYQIGFVKIIFDTCYLKPPTKITKILTKLGKKGLKHWFQNKNINLMNAKIQQSVYDTIKTSWRTEFIRIISNLASMNKSYGIFVVNPMVNINLTARG